MCKHLSRMTLLVLVGAAILGGCASPRHTNTLIFGTNTKFALDASQDPTGSPSVTVGYKRQEAVWMPLLANVDKDGTPAACDSNCLYKGDGQLGEPGEGSDTYSVLASFGAQFSGGSNPQSGASTGGALAQYFATGLAARILAARGGASLVSIQPSNGVSEEIKAAAAKQITLETLAIEQILGYANTSGKVDGAKLTTLTPGTGKDANWANTFAGKPIGDLRTELEIPSRAVVPKLASNIPK